jgi:hypothetical protein
MAKHIFVSYNFNDRHVKQTVKSMMDAHQGEIDGQMVFVENDVSYNGAAAIDWEIEHVMADCDAALFVLADNPRNSPWLNREASHALSKDIPIVTTVLPGVEGVHCGALAHSDCIHVDWDACAITEQLNQC